MLWCILGALKVLHRGTALHRDVSPDNIFLQDSGPPVLLDLGAARLAIGDTAKQHTAILKVNYAPIEQYADSQGVPQGPWTDLYALAAVVHGLLCNEPPLPAMIRVVNDKMPPFANVVKTVASEFGQGYSEQFTQAISMALNIQPQDRPQSVREFARSLGLVTPHGMSSFDWRAELGPACLPVGDAPPSALARAGTIEQTRPSNSNPDYAPTQFIGDGEDDDPDSESANAIANWGPDSTPAQNHKPVERRHRSREPVSVPAAVESHSTVRRKKSKRSATKPEGSARASTTMVWILAASLALLTVVAAGWGWRNWSAKGKAPATTAVTAPAQPEETFLTPVPPISPASNSPAGAESDRKSEPIETIIESSAPARAAPASADKNAKTADRPRIAASKPAKVEVPRAPVIAEAPSTPAPAVATTPAPEPKPAPPVVTPEKLCSDANFLTRPMCMFRACQRPDLSGTATCVELQKNLQRSKDINENSKF